MREISKEEHLFKKHYKSLCHFAWEIVRDVAWAEDIVQDTFVNYFSRQKYTAEGESAIRNFLYTSVRFACYNGLRRNKIDHRYITSLDKSDTWYDSGIELKMIRAEVLAEVYRIMEMMPKGCQEIFRKGYLEGLSNLEIADELDISINTVKTQKKRAMKILMSKIRPDYLPVIILLFP